MSSEASERPSADEGTQRIVPLDEIDPSYWNTPIHSRLWTPPTNSRPDFPDPAE